MAESIMTQITMAGGAVNLAFNEVVYSWISSQADNAYVDNKNRVEINNYNWDCMLVYHPQAINPFVAFRSSGVTSLTTSNLVIQSADPNGTRIYLLGLNASNYYYLYGSCTMLLLA